MSRWSPTVRPADRPAQGQIVGGAVDRFAQAFLQGRGMVRQERRQDAADAQARLALSLERARVGVRQGVAPVDERIGQAASGAVDQALAGTPAGAPASAPTGAPASRFAGAFDADAGDFGQASLGLLPTQSRYTQVDAPDGAAPTYIDNAATPEAQSRAFGWRQEETRARLAAAVRAQEAEQRREERAEDQGRWSMDYDARRADAEARTAESAAQRATEARRVALQEAQLRQTGAYQAGMLGVARQNAGTAATRAQSAGKTAGTQASEGERKARAMLGRAAAAKGALDAYGLAEAKGGKALPSQLGLLALQNPMGMQTRGWAPEAQLWKQQAMEFLTSVLRPESGGAITPDEFEMYKDIFIPLPGDADPTIAAKRAARERAVQMIHTMGGRANDAEAAALLRQSFAGAGRAAAAPAAPGAIDPDAILNGYELP